MSVFDAENINPNNSRGTPTLLRKNLQRKESPSAVLSPTKRRKQNHSDKAIRTPLDSTPKAVWKEEPQELAPAVVYPKHVLFEVLARLDQVDVLERCAPVCRVWNEVSKSPDLWAIMRRHLRLLDQLRKIEKIVERRSKGKLYKAIRLGTQERVLVRIVNLELTNAGKDDGVPTSFLREAALLSKLKHTNVVKFEGAEIVGKDALTCTEFVYMNFSTWFKTLEMQNTMEKRCGIQQKFREVCNGLSYLHNNGLMHRNLKPDNIFLTEMGVVKIGDFTTSRMLDIPFQAYTPEDPKERDRSGREMRRLWYRAPELILRQEIYGPKGDLWSVGCLIAEAAAGKPLFPSDSEIDHLFRVFRVAGSPTLESWPEVITMKNFSPQLPIYSAIDMAQVTRAVCFGNEADYKSLSQQLNAERSETLELFVTIASTLKAEGMSVLEKLITANPAKRIGVDEMLSMHFFDECNSVDRQSDLQIAPQTQEWLANGQRGTKKTSEVEVPKETSSQNPCPQLPTSPDMMPTDSIHSMLKVAVHRERSSRTWGRDVIGGGLDAAARATVVDNVVGLAVTLGLTDYTLHLACGLFDKYLALSDTLENPNPLLVGTACLKVADIFSEQSKEYYKQENAVEYADATFHNIQPQDLIQTEKDVLCKLGFDLNLPTCHWFLKCYLAISGFKSGGLISRAATFIGDLTLLDHNLSLYPPSLRAQCVFVLSVFLMQHSHPALKAATPEQKAAIRMSSTGEELHLPLLDTWDSQVRKKVCANTSTIDAEMCLQAVVHMMIVLRRDWKQVFKQVEQKHFAITKTIVYPEHFPVSKLLKYIIVA
jgi:serine/threonine protein kinase